jgi:hypothetical protein
VGSQPFCYGSSCFLDPLEGSGEFLMYFPTGLEMEAGGCLMDAVICNLDAKIFKSKSQNTTEDGCIWGSEEDGKFISDGLSSLETKEDGCSLGEEFSLRGLYVH